MLKAAHSHTRSAVLVSRFGSFHLGAAGMGVVNLNPLAAFQALLCNVGRLICEKGHVRIGKFVVDVLSGDAFRKPVRVECFDK
jgi:hypothetical protein